jgi:hypothetical protein
MKGLFGPGSVVRQSKGGDDQSRRMNIKGNVVGSNASLGDIVGSTASSVSRLGDSDQQAAGDLKPLLEQLIAILYDGTARGLPQEVARDVMTEAGALADAAARPTDDGAQSAIRKTLRTLRGFVDEFEAVPEIADKYKALVARIVGLF